MIKKIHRSCHGHGKRDHNLDWKLLATGRDRADIKYFPFPREDLILLMDLRVNIFLSHSNYL